MSVDRELTNGIKRRVTAENGIKPKIDTYSVKI